MNELKEKMEELNVITRLLPNCPIMWLDFEVFIIGLEVFEDKLQGIKNALISLWINKYKEAN